MKNNTPQNTGDSNQTPSVYSFLYKNLQAVFFFGFALSVVLFFVPCAETNVMVLSLFDCTRLCLQNNVNLGLGSLLFFSFCSSLTFAVLTIQHPRRWVFIAGACYTSFWLLYDWFLSGPDDGSVKVYVLWNVFQYASSAMILTGFWIRPDTSPTCKSYVKKCQHCNASLSFFRIAKMTEWRPNYTCPHCGGISTVSKSQLQIKIIGLLLGCLAAYLFNLHYGMGKPAFVGSGVLIGIILWAISLMVFGKFEPKVLNGKPSPEQILPANANTPLPTPMPLATDGSSTASRLTELLALKEKGLISSEDYEKKKSEIVRDL